MVDAIIPSCCDRCSHDCSDEEQDNNSRSKSSSKKVIQREGKRAKKPQNLQTSKNNFQLPTSHTAFLDVVVLDDNLAALDGLDEVVRVLAVDGAADRLGGAENLLDSAGHLAGHGARAHGLGRGDDVLPGDVAVVLDVLLLLAVAGRLLERADDEGGSRRNHRDLSLAVLDGQLHRHLQTLPVLRLLGDIITDLLGRLLG
jgi:hypothetical protein